MRLAGDGRVEGDLAAARARSARRLQQLALERLDLGGVGGVVDGDRRALDAVGLAARDQLLEGLGLAGDDQRGGAVDRPPSETSPA